MDYQKTIRYYENFDMLYGYYIPSLLVVWPADLDVYLA